MEKGKKTTETTRQITGSVFLAPVRPAVFGCNGWAKIFDNFCFVFFFKVCILPDGGTAGVFSTLHVLM